MTNRYYELDAVRGIALLLMILYHTLFCLSFFTSAANWFNPAVHSGAPIAFMFIFIAGVSLVLSAGKNECPKTTAKKFALRGLYVLLFAAAITLVTFIAYPSGCVVFGVLHLIGVGTILSIPFIALKVKTPVIFALGLILIALTYVISKIYAPAFLIPLGFASSGFYTIDYEPLIPWFGVMLLGIAVGRLVYKNGARCRLFELFGKAPAVLRPLCFIGRHTLFVYVIHVPIIIFVICCIFGFSILGSFI